MPFHFKNFSNDKLLILSFNLFSLSIPILTNLFMPKKHNFIPIILAIVIHDMGGFHLYIHFILEAFHFLTIITFWFTIPIMIWFTYPQFHLQFIIIKPIPDLIINGFLQTVTYCLRLFRLSLKQVFHSLSIICSYSLFIHQVSLSGLIWIICILLLFFWSLFHGRLAHFLSKKIFYFFRFFVRN